MPHRDPLTAARARIEALELELRLVREERPDLALYASFHAEVEALRAENEALRAENEALRRALESERAARGGTADERARLEAELAALRAQVEAVRDGAEAVRDRAEAPGGAVVMRVELVRRHPAELDDDPTVRRVDPDRVAQGDACPMCHAEGALALHAAGDGLASVVCAQCGYSEVRTAPPR